MVPTTPQDAAAAATPLPRAWAGSVCVPAGPAARRLVPFAAIAMLGLLAGCASGPRPALSPVQEANQYKAHAKSNYDPPGPPEDPWGPYITEAAKRFDVPDVWVREVMRVESGGKMYRNGALTVSPVGAMGLMQLMPDTYDEVSARYGLGEDPYDPHNNILAGAAYIREMYDAFGSPGFLAAYNAGPARLEDYLTHNRPLPAETRRYVAMIGPNIQGAYPQTRSPADQLAVNQLPVNIPPGPRYRSRHEYALATRERRNAATRLAAAAPAAAKAPPAPRITPAFSAPEVAFAPEAASPAASGKPRGLHLIQTANAAEAVPHDASRGWGVQVGAFGRKSDAASAAGHARAMIGSASTAVIPVSAHGGTLYRARVVGLSRADAQAACAKLSHGHNSCVVVSPASDSEN